MQTFMPQNIQNDMSTGHPMKEEEEERQAQSRILQLLKDKDVTKDFLAYVEERNKYGLSLIPETVFCEQEDAYSVGTPDYDFQVDD
jgi:hypothetical protein